MGYCMTQSGCGKFQIKAKDMPKALKALKDMLAKKKDYTWVTSSDIEQAKTLNEAINAWGWDLDMDDEGNATALLCNSEKLGEEHLMFDIIAPFVKKGAFIDMFGEDGTNWRWAFDGKHCVEKTAKVSYEE
jgi:hypothetical protein